MWEPDFWKYEDMLDLSRPISRKRKAMGIEERAMQFAPFATLTGYNQVLKEMDRYNEDMVEHSIELVEWWDNPSEE